MYVYIIECCLTCVYYYVYNVVCCVANSIDFEERLHGSLDST